MIKLHDYILSADCYKVRLMLALFGREFEPAKINVHPGRENQTARFLSLNPRGRIPVLEDDGLILSDPIAILTYLALRFDPERKWLPADAAMHAQVMMWLGFSCAELDRISQIRMDAITSAGIISPEEIADAHKSLSIVEDHLLKGNCSVASGLSATIRRLQMSRFSRPSFWHRMEKFPLMPIPPYGDGWTG
jgi:glutathione S-transferase